MTSDPQHTPTDQDHKAAEVVQALAPKHKMHFETAAGGLACGMPGPVHLKTTQRFAATCAACQKTIKKLSQRASCKHTTLRVGTRWVLGDSPIAPCAACGAYMRWRPLTCCWGEGCAECSQCGYEIGPRAPDLEPGAVKEL